MSLVNDHTSEWRKRPINLLKVVTSFVSQLTVGDDLTKISLPTGFGLIQFRFRRINQLEICHPFSMLEVMSHRELVCFSVLFELNKHPEDAFERFLCVGYGSLLSLSSLIWSKHAVAG
jgi:hypothetical protein